MKSTMLLGVVLFACSSEYLEMNPQADTPNAPVELFCRLDQDCLPGLSCNVFKNRCENSSLCWNGVHDRDWCSSSPYFCSSETGLDCGGGLCGPCTPTQRCLQGSDCFSGECRNNQCQPFSTCDEFLVVGPLERQTFRLIFYDRLGRILYQNILDSVCIAQLSNACEVEARCESEELGVCKHAPAIYLVKQEGWDGVFGFEEVEKGKYRARINGKKIKDRREALGCGAGTCRYCEWGEFCRADADCLPPYVCRGWCREDKSQDT